LDPTRRTPQERSLCVEQLFTRSFRLTTFCNHNCSHRHNLSSLHSNFHFHTLLCITYQLSWSRTGRQRTVYNNNGMATKEIWNQRKSIQKTLVRVAERR